MPWITTKTGKHINTDWFDEDTKRKESQIKVNQNEAKKKTIQEVREVTEEDIKKKLIPEDSYTNDPEYKKAIESTQKAFREREEYGKKYRELDDELKKESKPKPKEEWDDDDEFHALLGDKPRIYTDRGKELLKEHDEAWEKWKKADHEWSELSDRLRKIDQEQARRQKQENVDYSGVSDKLQDDYFGFKKDKSTTPYIDNLLEKGKAQVIEMPPELYMKEVAHKIFTNATLETAFRGTSVANVNKYMRMMQDGVKFDTPYLNYRDNEQEGRHRALAAMMLGIKKIPVIVVRR